MMASVDGIADGALKAAEIAMARRQTVPQIAILVGWSKISNESKGRRRNRTSTGNHGSEVAVTGFYSYGEMAPNGKVLVNFIIKQ
jgi:hypothetical protein